jgi:hypothetical protein
LGAPVDQAPDLLLHAQQQIRPQHRPSALRRLLWVPRLTSVGPTSDSPVPARGRLRGRHLLLVVTQKLTPTSLRSSLDRQHDGFPSRL